MKSINIKLLSFLFITAGFLLSSCEDQWDDSIKVNSSSLTGNVMESIEANPDLTEFTKMLKETGYDLVLQSDNNYTVLAPSNVVLASYANASEETKKSLVRNHIAPLSFPAYKLAKLENLMMINGKNLLLEKIQLTDTELLCNNGVLRIALNVIMPAENIFEFLQNKKGDYEMAAAILAFGDSVMDMDKSIQKGVDSQGRPVYDTVYKYKNHYLDKIAIQNEDSIYTFVLLDNENFNVLKAKYAKYTAQYDPILGSINTEKTDSVAVDELAGDLVFYPGNDEGDTFTSLTGISVDMSSASFIDDIDASNGRILITNGVNIKMKQNKIKDIYIQGEDYLETSDINYTYVRLRDYAMGGRDVMVAGRSTSSFTYKIIDQETEELKDTTIQSTYMYNTDYSTRYTKDINFYLKYASKLYSTKYNVYWVTYDDLPAHFAGNENDPDFDPENPNNPCSSIYRVDQKLYISLPGRPELKRSSGIISNNEKVGPSTAVAMTGIDPEQIDSRTPARGVNAGIRQEQPLRWFLGKGDYHAINTIFPLAATRDIFDCTSMGDATFFVTNSPNVTDAKSTDNGMIFLDYIRLVPVFDEDE